MVDGALEGVRRRRAAQDRSPPRTGSCLSPWTLSVGVCDEAQTSPRPPTSLLDARGVVSAALCV